MSRLVRRDSGRTKRLYRIMAPDLAECGKGDDRAVDAVGVRLGDDG